MFSPLRSVGEAGMGTSPSESDVSPLCPSSNNILCFQHESRPDFEWLWSMCGRPCWSRFRTWEQRLARRHVITCPHRICGHRPMHSFFSFLFFFVPQLHGKRLFRVLFRDKRSRFCEPRMIGALCSLASLFMARVSGASE
jgi:hypothetical protein